MTLEERIDRYSKLPERSVNVQQEVTEELFARLMQLDVRITALENRQKEEK